MAGTQQILVEEKTEGKEGGREGGSEEGEGQKGRREGRQWRQQVETIRVIASVRAARWEAGLREQGSTGGETRAHQPQGSSGTAATRRQRARGRQPWSQRSLRTQHKDLNLRTWGLLSWPPRGHWSLSTCPTSAGEKARRSALNTWASA